MTDLAVIILTKDEKLHIGRCLERIAPLEPRQVFVVDCFSTDGTQEIVEKWKSGGVGEWKSGGVGQLLLVEHEWPGNQAVQFNWAIDNLPIEASWVLRLDADEYLTPELTEEIKSKLPSMPDGVDGVVLKRRHIFAGKWVKYGTYPIKLLRLYRTGRARYSDGMLMDEHLQVDGGVVEFDGDFVDHSLIPFEEWREKHRAYAMREAQMVLDGNVNRNKRCYYACPPRLRAVLFFLWRYVVRGGFLNGKAGLKWDFWQGLWYRWTIDGEISRLRHRRSQEQNAAVDLSQYRNRHGLRNIFTRILWSMVWIVAAKWMPRFFFNKWRALLLRMFGAKIGKSCRLTGSMEVWIPSRLRMGNFVWIDRNVYLYDVDRITIGDNAIISDGAYICTASHDISKGDFPLVTAPVTIGAGAWVAAYACVMPGVTIGEGAVVAAGAVVTKDVPPWTVVGGNPAKFIKKRELVVSG